MKPEAYTNALRTGWKVKEARRPRGTTQTDLGDLLGITKQTVSKTGQTGKPDDEGVKQVAEALGATEGGLKEFIEETVLYYTNNFYGNSNAAATSIGTISDLEDMSHFSMDQAVKLFEELLKIEREKYNGEKKESAE